MPSNILTADTMFPHLKEEQSTDEKFTVITNYLYMLLEQLRYTLDNLGQENFNDAEFTSISKIITDPVYLQLQDDEGDIAALQVTAQGLASRIVDAEGNISTLTQTSTSLLSRVSDAEGNISSLTQTVYNMTLSVSNGTESSTITLMANGIALSSKTISMSGLVTYTGLADGTTTINGGCIKTGLIQAQYLQLAGSITWNDLSNGVQENINYAYATGYNASQDVLALVNGNYSGGTFINGTIISAPTIVGGSIFWGTNGTYGSLTRTYGNDGVSVTNIVQLRSSEGLVLAADTNIRIEGNSIWVNIDVYDIHVKKDGTYVRLSSLLS